MILKVTDKTGDTVVDTEQDIDLARELFKKATEKQMWGKGIKNGQAQFVPSNTRFEDLNFDELIMLPQQVGG